MKDPRVDEWVSGGILASGVWEKEIVVEEEDVGGRLRDEWWGNALGAEETPDCVWHGSAEVYGRAYDLQAAAIMLYTKVRVLVRGRSMY